MFPVAALERVQLQPLSASVSDHQSFSSYDTHVLILMYHAMTWCQMDFMNATTKHVCGTISMSLEFAAAAFSDPPYERIPLR